MCICILWPVQYRGLETHPQVSPSLHVPEGEHCSHSISSPGFWTVSKTSEGSGLNIVGTSLKPGISAVRLYKFSKENGFSGDFYTKQFHWSTLDGNIDVAMKNNHSFTKKVSILRNHQQSEKTLQSIILNDSVFHHVEYRFKGINPSSVMVCN